MLTITRPTLARKTSKQIETIESDAYKLVRYYANNALKPNVAKYHLMLISTDKDIFVMI